MKYKVIEIPNRGKIVVDESAEIRYDDYYVTWEDNYKIPQWVIYVLNSGINGKTPYKIIATINFSLDGDVPMVIVEDEVERLSEESVSAVTEGNVDFYLRDVYKEFFKEGYRAQQKLYSEQDLLEAFHVGRVYSGREGDTTFRDFRERLKQEYIELEVGCGELRQCFCNSNENCVLQIIKTNRDENGQLIAYLKQ